MSSLPARSLSWPASWPHLYLAGNALSDSIWRLDILEAGQVSARARLSLNDADAAKRQNLSFDHSLGLARVVCERGASDRAAGDA